MLKTEELDQCFSKAQLLVGLILASTTRLGLSVNDVEMACAIVRQVTDDTPHENPPPIIAQVREDGVRRAKEVAKDFPFTRGLYDQ